MSRRASFAAGIAAARRQGGAQFPLSDSCLTEECSHRVNHLLGDLSWVDLGWVEERDHPCSWRLRSMHVASYPSTQVDASIFKPLSDPRPSWSLRDSGIAARPEPAEGG